jgi:hypothetical protein
MEALGSTILKLRPLVSVLSTGSITSHCSYCHTEEGSPNTGTLKRCTMCKVVWYDSTVGLLCPPFRDDPLNRVLNRPARIKIGECIRTNAQRCESGPKKLVKQAGGAAALRPSSSRATQSELLAASYGILSSTACQAHSYDFILHSASQITNFLHPG